MSKEIDDVHKEIIKTNKELHSMEDKVCKDIQDIKKIIKNLDKKISTILHKIEEFEVVIDAAELLQSKIDDEEEEDYDSGWRPYDNEYEPEEYENYDVDGFENDDEEL
jgi:hypothetical protein